MPISIATEVRVVSEPVQMDVYKKKELCTTDWYFLWGFVQSNLSRPCSIPMLPLRQCNSSYSKPQNIALASTTFKIRSAKKYLLLRTDTITLNNTYSFSLSPSCKLPLPFSLPPWISMKNDQDGIFADHVITPFLHPILVHYNIISRCKGNNKNQFTTLWGRQFIKLERFYFKWGNHAGKSRR